jgi:hypothetical protein
LPWNCENLAGFKEPVVLSRVHAHIQATCWTCHRKEPSDEEKRGWAIKYTNRDAYFNEIILS